MSNFPKSTTTNKRAPIVRARQVWHFVDFEGRFGYDPGKMPVQVAQYVRWHINAWDGASGAVVRAVAALRAEKDFIWLQGAVLELLCHTVNQDRQYQGYLLSSRMDPATASEIGSMLRVDGRKARAVLIRLEKVGFLEQVSWPPVEPAGDILDDHSLRLLQGVQDAAQKGGRKRQKKPPGKGRKRGQALITEIESEKSAAQKPIGIGFDESTQSPPGSGQAVRSDAEPPSTPTTTPAIPTTSTRSDAGGGPAAGLSCRGHAGRNASPASILSLGDVLSGQAYRYSAGGQEFAAKILTASGYLAVDAAAAACERAHWAKAFDELVATFDGSTVLKICQKTLVVAQRIRTERHRYDNPESYLLRCLQNAGRDAKRAGKAVG